MIPVVRQPEEERGNLTPGAGRRGCCSSGERTERARANARENGHRLCQPQIGGGPRLSASDKGEASQREEEPARKAVRNTARA